MSSIANLYQQAQLAEAAYADFTNSQIPPATALQTGDSKFSAAQAAEFVSHWRVVDQYTATGWFGASWTGTGFSATLFQNTDTNTYSLAGTRTVLEYLLSPLRKVVFEAGREM